MNDDIHAGGDGIKFKNHLPVIESEEDYERMRAVLDNPETLKRHQISAGNFLVLQYKIAVLEWTLDKSSRNEEKRMSNEWSELIKRYADGRKICNCGQAYYSMTGEAMLSGSGKMLRNYPECLHGCQANAYNIKDDIARRVLAELRGDATPDAIPGLAKDALRQDETG